MAQPSINFIELVALTRITPDSTVERFGSLINSSFFDASNILATLKQKGLVDFVTAFPSQSTLKITDLGTATLAEANKKAAEPQDALDLAILGQLSNGRRGLVDLASAINVAQTDLALRLFKLSTQQYMSFELVNGNMSIYLTEKGFLSVKTAVQQVPQPAAAPGAQQKPPLDTDLKQLEDKIMRDKKTRRLVIIIVAGVVVIILLVLLIKMGIV